VVVVRPSDGPALPLSAYSRLGMNLTFDMKLPFKSFNTGHDYLQYWLQ
jgi:hypothetical protein